MPASSDPDTVFPNNTSSHNQKPPQKQPITGAHNLTKKERRNGAAKDNNSASGGVKLSTKMSDSTKPSPSGASPRSGPRDTGTISGTADHGHGPSPLLDALSSNAFITASAQNTNEWARNVPAFSTSPGNLITLSDSPPTQPSSYPDDKDNPVGWNVRERGMNNGQFSAASSPPNRRRPLSFQMDGQPVLEDRSTQHGAYTYRRSSMYAQQPQRYGSMPPLPHQPQAHFYSAPDPSFGLPSRTAGLKPGSRGYYCGFDDLPAFTDDGTKQVENVAICGYEGGLDIYGIGNHGLDKVINITGLRGGIFSAKILPWRNDIGRQSAGPLIALVIHGPALSQGFSSNGGREACATSEPSSFPSSERGSTEEFSPPLDAKISSSITGYQTTVEIYSLSSKEHVTTLLSVPEVPLIAPITSSLFCPPPPTGLLSISADTGHVVVASGTTGEVWIFEQSIPKGEAPDEFRCIGKIWTAVQSTSLRDAGSPSEHDDRNSLLDEQPNFVSQQTKFPLLSLKGRWLAWCPSSTASQVSLKATVFGILAGARIPGLNSFAPPQTPQTTCIVDIPNKDGVYNDIVRMGTQGVLKGAGWIGDHGKQVWNSYWNKSPNVPNTAGITGWNGSSPPSNYPSAFPPTHGEALPHNTRNGDSNLISLLDLEKLGTIRTHNLSSGPHPFATFETPLGCSFISFAPNGLSLFTASSKGDVQFVWDLMRTQYTKSSLLQTRPSSNTPGLHVRQVARFTRMTVARIVDVIWALPRGERLAVITERNTVHFLDLPASAFDWPPPRRRVEASQTSSPTPLDVVDMPKAAATIATNTFKGAWSFAQPLINRPRGLSGPGRPAISTASMTAQAGYGTKVLAAGISKSFGAASGTIEQFRKSGENILRLPPSTTPLSIGCIHWMRGQHKDSIAAIVEGVVKVYRIRQKKSKANPDRRHASVGSRPNDFKIPFISDRKIAPKIGCMLELDDELDFSEKEPEGSHWNLGGQPAVKAGNHPGIDSSIPQAEIESNAPYQPFHTDRRVGLRLYQSAPRHLETVTSLSSSMLDGQSQAKSRIPPMATSVQSAAENDLWVFGRPILSTKLDVGPAEADFDDLDPELRSAHLALPLSAMERITTKVPDIDEDVEQIVVTTRRRKGQHGNTLAENEGFFEDDCEVLDFASQRV